MFTQWEIERYELGYFYWVSTRFWGKVTILDVITNKLIRNYSLQHYHDLKNRIEPKMPTIQFTEKDLKRGIIVTPAWYRVKIDETGEKLSKAGDSTNYLISGTILRNADNGDEKFAGVPIDWNFNSKAIGFMKGFFEALGHEVTTDKRFDTSQAEGEIIDMRIDNDMYEGRPKNQVNHFYRIPRED